MPAGYRTIDGFGPHSFQWVNAAGEAVLVKYHFKIDQGIEAALAAEAARLAGALYRLMNEAEKQRLAANIANRLGQASKDEIVDRSIGDFRKADPDYGESVAKAVAAKRAAR